eukprot:2073069-Rhodomonas_salina.1
MERAYAVSIPGDHTSTRFQYWETILVRDFSTGNRRAGGDLVESVCLAEGILPTLHCQLQNDGKKEKRKEKRESR